MYTNGIEQIEQFAERMCSGEPETLDQLIREIRAELAECLMSPSYRDQMVARMTLRVPDLEPNLEKRLFAAARKIVRAFYTFYRNEGFNDQAIALMGNNVKLIIDE